MEWIFSIEHVISIVIFIVLGFIGFIICSPLVLKKSDNQLLSFIFSMSLVLIMIGLALFGLFLIYPIIFGIPKLFGV